MFLCKADAWAVANAPTIEDNEADGHLGREILRYLAAEVITVK